MGGFDVVDGCSVCCGHGSVRIVPHFQNYIGAGFRRSLSARLGELVWQLLCNHERVHRAGNCCCAYHWHGDRGWVQGDEAAGETVVHHLCNSWRPVGARLDLLDLEIARKAIRMSFELQT